MNPLIYIIARLFFAILVSVFGLSLDRMLKLFVKLGYVFIAFMAVYIFVRHMLAAR